MTSSNKSSDERSRLRRRLAGLLVALAVLIGLSVAWSASPLKTWLDVDLIVASLQRLGQSYGYVVATCGFALAVATAVPLTFLTIVTIVAFGPGSGYVCCLSGALLGAALSYAAGQFLGRDVVTRLAGERVNLLSRRLAERGVLAVIVVRLVPIAPFAVVNLVAGASHIRLRDLLLGTAIGMTPATLAIMLFTQQIIAAFRQPTPVTYLLIGATIILIALGGWGMRRALGKIEKGSK